MNPSVLGCFGLALTIAVWGYNYRLSLYHPHHGDTATRALAAKVWLDHRNVAAAAAPVAKYRIHPTTLRVDLKPRVFAPSFKWVLIALPTDGNRAFHSASLLPLRSPPSRSFSA
ncbi:MAG TPA: hypothetical protein VHZ28_01645 [Terracidiphilus sp.]|nr:hypothetical protein [Terracidiphilus sp.]